jgi:hypothetical protein
VERCKHVKSQANTGVFQARQATVGIYICTTDVGNNRSRDGRGGKPGRNRWCATTGPPQTLRRLAQRLSRFGGRAARSGRLDAEEVVVGGAVGGKLDGTCYVGGGARTGGACATGRPLRGGCAGG